MSEQECHADMVSTPEADAVLSSNAPLADIAIEALIDEGPQDTQHTAQIDDVEDAGSVTRPADVPEKFWDAEGGTLRTETLLKSYLELERKLGTMVPLPTADDPASRDKLQRVLGKPASADDYKIKAPHELITPDPAINTKLHEAGLSTEQAQLVYDLAAEHLVPLVEEVNKEASGRIERSQLAAHFGGKEKWQTIAPQIKIWAQANLSDDVYESLGSSAEGVIAIYHMMQTREPNVISEAAIPAAATDERQLSQMMRDPRYWRDRDPAFVAEVTAGYRRLFD
ncbi:MAG: hypothetical protein R3F54_15530 [Alphaproteobacteria bacterium]